MTYPYLETTLANESQQISDSKKGQDREDRVLCLYYCLLTEVPKGLKWNSVKLMPYVEHLILKELHLIMFYSWNLIPQVVLGVASVS